ncbi:MAG: hypothetical protein WC757_03925 [Candidatus Paceibacterota bacterium]
MPELSEFRMIARAPDQPVDFGADREYILCCLQEVERSFKLNAFPGIAPEQVSARALIKQLITWWRTLEPTDPDQQDAFGRMPGAIRLIDTYSLWLGED